MEFFKINGKSIKAPTEISISYEELDKEERTVDGTMVVDTNAVKGGIFTGVSFHDNATGNLISITARAEGLAYLPQYNWSKGKLIWKSVAVAFRER